MSIVVQQLINGLMLGSIYALIGVGYSLIFGVLRMLNLAQSYFLMAAPFIVLCLYHDIGMPAPLALLLAMAVMSALGVLLYFVSFAPVPQSHPLGGFVSSLAFGIVIQTIVVAKFGTLPHGFELGLPLSDITFGDIILSGAQLLTLVLSVIVMASMSVIIYSTRFGRNVRALAENDRAARLLGVRVRETVLMVFVISSLLAAIAGLLIAIRFENITTFLSDRFALKALAVIVIGGVADMRGAVLAGLLLGVAEVQFQAYLPAGWSEAFVWIAMILVLLAFPNGLFGGGIRRREV